MVVKSGWVLKLILDFGSKMGVLRAQMRKCFKNERKRKKKGEKRKKKEEK